MKRKGGGKGVFRCNLFQNVIFSNSANKTKKEEGWGAMVFTDKYTPIFN